MINNVVLTGRLTKELDLRYTSNGTAVATGTLAVNRSFKNADGDYEADYPRIQVWRKAAENLANFTQKGSLIGIEGRIQTGSYEKDGQRVYTTEIVVDKFTLLESRNNQNSQQSSRGQTQTNSGNTFSSNEDQFLNSGQSIDISDDDLPF
ncbi:single-stranded DNA-binding protein [Jeotgalibaca porci]|uniref:single-stranded DNA-binding protein n=1 Tax=Jeotgalibaca porci TaxID=1868793 RepID=UPI0035A05428